MNLFRRQIQIFRKNIVDIFVDDEQQLVRYGKVLVLILEHVLDGGDGDK